MNWIKHFFKKNKKWTFEDHFKVLQANTHLGRFSEYHVFGTQTKDIDEKLKKDRPLCVKPEEELKVDRVYDKKFEFEGRNLRYAFIPASCESRGLVVVFHAWNGYQYVDHIKSWPCFDVLAPFDDFGPHRWACGFWGLDGNSFLVRPIQALIQKVLNDNHYSHWFTMGGSLGGFGALYHGILGGCDGMYVMTPQLDIRAMSEQDLKKGYTNDVYTPMLSSVSPKNDPNVFELASSQAELPPLFLIQAQYDTINPFAQHAYLMQEIYNQKMGWYGMRIYPAIGHRADGSQSEAEYLFLLIQKKNPPKKFIY